MQMVMARRSPVLSPAMAMDKTMKTVCLESLRQSRSSRFGTPDRTPDSSTMPIMRWSGQRPMARKVICMAFGGPQSNSQIAAAMSAAYDANIVLVAAAGNVPEGARTVQFPAAYPGVIAIAGTDRDGNHSKNSVTGDLITLAAPSDGIVSSDAGGGYITSSGTSNSTAIVAGAAALVRSRFPNLTAGEVVNRLTATAIDKGPPGRDDEYGYGLINLVGALTAKFPPAGSATQTPPATASSPTARGSTPSERQSNSLAPASRSTSTTIISIGGVIIVLLAVLGAWTLVRRRRPG